MSKKIMIIDEDIVELNRLSLWLGFKGYEVFPLHRSYKVFTEISRCNPDMIMLDATLSAMDSMVVSRALKTLEGSKNIPLILMAGKKDDDNFTYMLKQPNSKLNGNPVKTAGIDSMMKDIELYWAN